MGFVIVFHCSPSLQAVQADMQQGDDLSMLVATGLVMHRVFTFDKTPKYTLVYGVVLSAVVSLFIAWHCIMDETTVHSIFFGKS